MKARTVLFVVGTTTSLAAGAAVAFQAARKPPEATVSVTPTTVPVEEAVSVGPAVDEAVTPITARPVKTIAIIEPGATDPRADENLSSAAETSSSTPSDIASLVQGQREEAMPPPQAEAAPVARSPVKASHARKHSSTATKQSRSAKAKAQMAAAQEPPAPQPAYDASNENHSPFHSLGKVFSGVQ